jgi:hypothetical protein
MSYIKAMTHHGTFFGEIIEEHEDFVKISGYQDGFSAIKVYTFNRTEYNKLIIPTWKYITKENYDILMMYNKNGY